MKIYIFLLCVNITKLTLSQIDSCGLDYRPICTLNQYEIAVVNDYLGADQTYNLTEISRVAFVSGIGDGVLITRKREFFIDMRRSSKSEMNLQIIPLTEEEKQQANYDVFLVQNVKKFGSIERKKLMENLESGTIHIPGKNRQTPLQDNYIAVLEHIYNHSDTASLCVTQEKNQIIVAPKNKAGFSIVYDIAELEETDDYEMCYRISYQSNHPMYNQALFASAMELADWILVDNTTYVYKYGKTYSKKNLFKKENIRAHLYKMSLTQSGENLSILITLEEVDWNEYRRHRKNRKKT